MTAGAPQGITFYYSLQGGLRSVRKTQRNQSVAWPGEGMGKLDMHMLAKNCSLRRISKGSSHHIPKVGIMVGHPWICGVLEVLCQSLLKGVNTVQICFCHLHPDS